MMLAAMLAMMLVMAAPALAQGPPHGNMPGQCLALFCYHGVEGVHGTAAGETGAHFAGMGDACVKGLETGHGGHV
jgi:hypothetical protein